MLFIECLIYLCVFGLVANLAWLIWMLTGDDEAFRVWNFELEPGVDHMFWANKYMTDAKICMTHIDLNNEAIWYAEEIKDYYLVEFLRYNRIS